MEETLVSYLSPESSSSARSPVLPTKPVRTTSALVGKAYSATGQAAACLQTMLLLQAYKAVLLADLDEGKGIGPNAVCELRRATDLSLWATKETAKSIGRSMAALVATERHIWLNLSNIKGKDKNCPLWFSLTHPAPLRLDAMVQTWPRLHLYAFPPIALLPGVLERVCRDRVLLLLIAPRWPGRIWFPDIISLLDGPPLELPVRRDLLSQAGGSIFPPQPELWKLWAWPLWGPSS